MVVLQNSPLFCQLAEGELRRLREATQTRRFPRGAEIFKQGDTGDGLLLVKSGLVNIVGAVTGNQRYVFARIGAGDFFGEMAVLEDKPRSATALAAEDTEIYFIPRDVMLALVERSPQISLKLLREISSRLREFNQQYVREVLQAERLAAVGKFARSIVHDLKNPLNIIGLSADIANMPGVPEDKRMEANLFIRKQVVRINDMISEIMEFTQSAGSVTDLKPTDYATFVRALLEEMQMEFDMKKVSLTFAQEPPAVTLPLNTKRLKHLFHNLINNAVQMLPKGGQLTFHFRVTDCEVVTELEDSGPGIAPEIAA
ncbi:MAG: hypothetical protein RLZZ350_90, partial [Verrucomicrobiota bacterium]